MVLFLHNRDLLLFRFPQEVFQDLLLFISGISQLFAVLHNDLMASMVIDFLDKVHINQV